MVQARIAARRGVGLDTVLRRYCAGYALFGDFLIEEAQEALQGPALKRLLRIQASLFDRVIAAVCEEHRREGKAIRTSERQRLEVVNGCSTASRWRPPSSPMTSRRLISA